MDDLISREQAIKQIQRYGVGCLDADEIIPEQAERFVINKIKELQPIKPETGHYKTRILYGRRYLICCECGMEKLDDRLPGWNFCPACGVRWEEQE